MTDPTAAALLHNTATRVTLGNTPLHAVPVTVAKQLKPLLESSTSLTVLTVHTQFTPPESLRLILLGASRCRSLQHMRLVGGISVLQSKMIMSAFMQFTFARRTSRTNSAVRPFSNPAGRSPHTPLSKRPSPAQRIRRNVVVSDAKMTNGGCQPGGYGRLNSPALRNMEVSKSPSPRLSWLNGVQMVLDLHHLDDVVAGFLLKGLERSERIVGLDLHIAPTSQAATRAAVRMLSHANVIVARNARRVRYLLSQNTPVDAAFLRGADKRDKTDFSLCSPLPEDVPRAEQREQVREGGEKEKEEWGREATTMRQGLSTFDLNTLPPRRYSPPRLLSGVPPDPSLRPMQPHVVSASPRIFDNGELEMGHMSRRGEQKQMEEEASHENECFVCSGGSLYTPEKIQASKISSDTINRRAGERREDGSCAWPAPKDPLETTQPSPSFSRHTPCSPPSPRGQFVQHIRYLHGCVRKINGVVVRYQMESRDSIQRLVAEMHVLEEQLTERVTSKLTDMLLSLSELEKQVE
ncbi:hypothetical protein C3747_135g65 [Trypanosoma cruzi]|uniref:Uncharacterized protein n=2 Tax=Trypanosoma cruzi TaxID=5693 RepID=Q4CTP6_TRYCC|nr:hypothetical protein, conserved [Trypanosoma cruzi]EAN83646.1 hypothetical protein, conserved [Trypanosoma cruzi]KAF5218078.1 hypothetical protein ECC02_008999 [Trypanosoma cruzi]PWV05289.1 hypothetical protein C3747_135g65 [Trypanosoma cruzi]|eukprot:XP_805497.1 hypothetical protein [Trypanosoma cruzi strain CL Brener]